MTGFLFTTTFATSLLLAHVTCFRTFLSEIPNSESVPDPCNPQKPWPGVGHVNPQGGGTRNPFGRLFSEYGKSWTGIVCDSDSDGDGITNGAELGDPDCEWVKGQTPRRTTNITHPGVCEPVDSKHCRARNGWLTCPEPVDPFCPALTQPDVKYLDFKLDKTRVPSNKTTWRCQILPWTEEGDFHVIGSKPLIDNADVTHHMIIFGCAGDVVPREGPYPCKMVPDRQCQDILLTWTMGSEGECLHKSEGLRMGSNGYKYIALQMHWNNPQQRDDYVDGSGLRAFYTRKLRQFDSVIMAVGQRYLELPPNSPEVVINSTCTAFCTQNMFKQPIFITRAVNHMHRLGRKQNVAVYREGRLLQYLTKDEVYDYDSPKFYRFDDPIEVLPGDEIRTTCTYSSVGVNKTTYYGESIKDEMCYAFLTYFPHQKSYTQYCTTFKSTQLCKRYLPSLNGIYDGCSWRAFTRGQDATAATLNKQMMTECGNKSSCSNACATSLNKMTQHPCMRGDISGYVTEHWAGKEHFRAYQRMCSEGVVSNPSGTDAKRTDSNGSTPLFSIHVVLLTLMLYFPLHISLS